MITNTFKNRLYFSKKYLVTQYNEQLKVIEGYENLVREQKRTMVDARAVSKQLYDKLVLALKDRQRIV